MAAKHFNRFKQFAGEKLSVREKSDRLTSNLSDAEKKVEEIRNTCQSVLKKLNACIQGSGNTFEKHQKKLPQFVLGSSMTEAAASMEPSLFTNVVAAAGKAELEISQNLTEYEMEMESIIMQPLTAIIDEEMKKIDKSKKKLSSARLDMDGTRNRYHSIQDKFSPKAEAVKSELDQATNHFEQCQDTYATNLFSFLSREREIASILHRMVVLQITHYQQTLNVLNQVLPHLDKELDVTTGRPVFGFDLEEHLKTSERSISYVIEECCLALRKEGMDSEGIFRLAASAAKLKLLKNAFDARCVELDHFDQHAIAGALKQYLRELPNPLLTFALHSEWIAAAGVADEGERAQQLWVVTKKLPEKIFENLKYLMYFFHDLSQHHEETKMNVNNLAIVIGPNLLWSKGDSTQGLVGETALYTRIADAMIKHPSYYFGDPPPLPISPETKRRPEKLITGSDTLDTSSVTETEEPDLDSTSNSIESVQSTSNETNTTCTSEFSQPITTPTKTPLTNPSPLPSSVTPSSEDRPTPPIRRNRSVRQRQSDPSPVVPSSPKTPTARRPAPQPPPSRSKTRAPPPSPPKDKPLPPVPKEKPNRRTSGAEDIDEETIL